MKTPSNFTLKCQLPILTAALLALPAAAQAQFTYTTNNGTITITGYTGSGGDVAIPDTINGLAVTSIGDGAFENHYALTSVTIPNSVAEIGNYAFADCNLTRVMIGNGVTSIGKEAFYDCFGQISIFIAANAPSVGLHAFSVFRPFGDYGYYSPENATVYYLSNTTGWSNSLAGLPAVMLNGPPQFGTTTDGWNYVSDQMENTFITGYAGSNNVVVVPSLINALPVTGIAPHAFFYDLDILTSVTIPDGVTSIGDSAFDECRNLTNVSIGNGVTYIGNRAFYQCYSLTNVTIGNSVTNIGNNAFDECSMKSVTIPNSVTSIGGSAFFSCVNLTSLAIGNGVTSIGDWAFGDCWDLTNVTIPENVTSIGDNAFDNCFSLTNVTIPEGVISIGASAFEFCYDLTSVKLPNSITSIGDDAFQDTALTSITIPKNVSTIGIGAFGSLYLLTKIFFAGSAPANANQYAFSYDYGDGVDWGLDRATAYYLPGTTGWAAFSANTGIPTALWLPQVQAGDASFGVRTNQFRFNIAWASGQTVVVEACTNLHNPVWSSVATNTLTSDSSNFSDPQSSNYPARFYRLRSP